MKLKMQIAHFLIIAVVQVIAILFLAFWLDGLQIESIPAAAAVAAAYILAQELYWWLFISFFSRLPVWLYPLLTFVLTGGVVMLVGNLIPGVQITRVSTGLWISIVLTVVNTILGSLLSLDLDEKFFNNVTRKLVVRRGQPIQTEVPGFLFLEIDGLGEKVFRQALEKGKMPAVKRWLDAGTHKITGWETDFTAQTGAMQTGILMGSNEEVPAYRWWDRKECRIVMSGSPVDAVSIEKRLSSGRGLLSDGGASRSNMFSGDAAESLFTFGTMLNRRHNPGPGFYLYLVSPFIIARLLTLFCVEVVKEVWQAWRQRLRKDRFIIRRRNLLYAFLRGVMGPVLQDLTTYTVISDVLRGLPAIYALYAGYDDLAHFAGMETPEAYGVLEETDRYFARIERALQYAPRPYHIVVLSDHGQSTGPAFQNAHGISLEEMVKGLAGGDGQVYASLESNEDWDHINILLTESISAQTRPARLMRTMLRSKTRDGLVTIGPERDASTIPQQQAQANNARIIVLASGCTGLIYFAQAEQRMTFEEIQSSCPGLVPGLIGHPSIGFLLVRSAEAGDMILGKEGIYFLDQDVYEGNNPLAIYGSHAAAHLKRESSFLSCPDLIVNTAYDPVSEELSSFEEQVSHHGGLGGPQNHAFILYPVALPYDGTPVIGASEVHRLLRGWRDVVQASRSDRTHPVQPGSGLIGDEQVNQE